MNSSALGGRRWRFRAFALASLVGLGSAPGPQARAEREAAVGYAAPAPVSARALLESLSRVKGLEASFVERKKLALLALPLQSTGKLFYLRPGRIARELSRPERSLVRVSPQTLHIEDSRGQRKIDLKSRPDLALFVQSFGRVLAGDYAGLERHYRLDFRPSTDGGNGWSLKLTPRAGPLAKLIAWVELLGKGVGVVELRVVETGGDSTVTTLSAVDPRRSFSEAERQRLFGLPPTSNTQAR